MKKMSPTRVRVLQLLVDMGEDGVIVDTEVTPAERRAARILRDMGFARSSDGRAYFTTEAGKLEAETWPRLTRPTLTSPGRTTPGTCDP